MFYYTVEDVDIKDFSNHDWSGVWEEYQYFLTSNNGFNFGDNALRNKSILESLGIPIVMSDDNYFLIKEDDFHLIELTGSLYTYDHYAEELEFFRIIRD